MIADLSYLNYPLPSDIAMLYASGRFEEMNRLIDLTVQMPNAPEALKKRLEFTRLCAEDTVNAYRLTPSEALRLAQEKIPDLTQAEFNTLTDERTLDWHYIDGERRYRNNCISNLLRTRSEYAARETGLTIQRERNEEFDALDSIIRTIRTKGQARVRMELRESITLESDRLTPGETIRLWLPLPVDCQMTVSSQVLRCSHTPVYTAPSDAPQRTAYFEVPYEKGLTVSMDLAWETVMNHKQPDPALVTTDLPAGDVTEADLAEVEPHILFTPYLKALVKQIVGDEQNPLIMARRIYDFITTKCTYRFMPSYRSIPDIVGYFCANLRGDCGVQALTFITMCRCCGIPARWLSGLYTAPLSCGMHDWAMFYVAPYGWLYADCSFGGSAYRAGSRERHDFYFGHLDPRRLPLASQFQAEFDPPTRFMRYDPYDSQVGEAETLTRRLSVDEIDQSHNLIRCVLCD
ncbi:MAG: transglutaminase domain-containing protein [Clostridia bacterium]|nr:transglutaminase domain-containing protein [Clostridia bacterium]